MKKEKLIGFLIGIAFLVTFPFVAQGTMYLSDSGFQDDGTDLFSVTLSGTQANLTLLTHLPFDSADAIAVTPDGTKLYAFDSYAGALGYYDLSSPSFTIIPGTVNIQEAVLSTFSSDGILYAASQKTDSLYIVNPTNAVTTLVGQIVNQSGAVVDVAGADIAYDSAGTFYLWTNSSSSRGLYELTIDPSTPIVNATFLGTSGSYFFTGLAVDKGGIGNILGSSHANLNEPGKIYEIDTTGGYITDYTMFLGGREYNYQYGDMSTGGVQPIPEPATLLLVGTGLIGLAGLRRKFRKR